VNATSLVRGALAGSGVELVASCGVDAYDAAAPTALRSTALAPGARGLVLAGSAGPALWRAFLAQTRAEPVLCEREHPYDSFVERILARADDALARAGVAFRRFEPTLHAAPRLDFAVLGRLAGLGSPGPFGMLVSREHGAWWALRGAWLVAADVDPPLPPDPPCAGCAAPCVQGLDRVRVGIADATPEVRARCIYGGASRYDDDQIDYHYDRAVALLRLRRT
jgi:epoxyqueuosine reductase QueG